MLITKIEWHLSKFGSICTLQHSCIEVLTCIIHVHVHVPVIFQVLNLGVVSVSNLMMYVHAITAAVDS